MPFVSLRNTVGRNLAKMSVSLLLLSHLFPVCIGGEHLTHIIKEGPQCSERCSRLLGKIGSEHFLIRKRSQRVKLFFTNPGNVRLIFAKAPRSGFHFLALQLTKTPRKIRMLRDFFYWVAIKSQLSTNTQQILFVRSEEPTAHLTRSGPDTKHVAPAPVGSGAVEVSLKVIFVRRFVLGKA